MRIIPSCLDVSKSSPSAVLLMCRSALEMVAPIVRLMSSWNDTFTRLPPASRMYSWISSIGATV